MNQNDENGGLIENEYNNFKDSKTDIKNLNAVEIDPIEVVTYYTSTKANKNNINDKN